MRCAGRCSKLADQSSGGRAAARDGPAPSVAEPKSCSGKEDKCYYCCYYYSHHYHCRVLYHTYSIATIYTLPTHHIPAMFPRRFAQSLQAAAKQSSVAPARIQRSAFISQNFTPAVSQRLSGMRMYSDAPEAEAKKAEEGSAKKEDSKTEEDPTKAELETKKKELLESNVRSMTVAIEYETSHTNIRDRTNSSTASPTSATFKTRPSARCKQPRTSPSSASPRT